MKVVASWSGGKDSCFACYKAIQEGYDVSNLLIMMSDPSVSNFHLIRSDMLDAQSEAIGIPPGFQALRSKRMKLWRM